MADRLGRYRDKRDPSTTSEPGLHPPRRAKRAGVRKKDPRFVIQKHDASSLHAREAPRRRGRESPLEYADDFESVIGKDNYGAGSVIVWDTGTYRNLDEERSMAEAIDAGHVKVWLEGEKLNGGWTLLRSRGGSGAQLLMIKRRDDGADARRNSECTEPRSILSGRTVAQAAAEDAGNDTA
ncbi:MAG: DNA ligase [Actinomycetota bacterium]|nr:DNA ligase [Actinomycetota bacterium]